MLAHAQFRCLVSCDVVHATPAHATSHSGSHFDYSLFTAHNFMYQKKSVQGIVAFQAVELAIWSCVYNQIYVDGCGTGLDVVLDNAVCS